MSNSSRPEHKIVQLEKNKCSTKKGGSSPFVFQPSPLKKSPVKDMNVNVESEMSGGKKVTSNYWLKNGFHDQAVIHILNRCNQLLNRKSGTHDVKQEYYYWISWLKNEFKYFHKINESSKKRVFKTLNKASEYLKKDIGTFKK